MGSENSEFVYGRYYFGEQAVAGNDMRGMQYYRSVTSGHARYPGYPAPSNSIEIQRIYHNNGSDDVARFGPFTRNVGATHVGAINDSPANYSLRSYVHNDVHIPSFPSFERNGNGPENSVNNFSQIRSIRSYDEGMRLHNNNGHDDVGLYERNNYGRGSSVSNSFHRSGDVGTSYNVGGIPELGSRLFSQNVHGPIRSYGTRAFHSNDYNDVLGSSSNYYSGGSEHGPSTQYTTESENNGFNYIPPRMTKSKHNGGSPVLQQFLNEEPVHIRGQADRVNFNILGSVENIDPSINAERLKLIYRIKKCFRTHAEETFKENEALFESHDWVEVWSTTSGGMKVYHAKMSCPICFGTTSPQNTEKEPGKMPKWHLTAVKRHVDMHSANASKPKTKEALSQPSKKQKNDLVDPSDSEKELSLSIQETTVELPPPNDPSEKMSEVHSNDSSSDFPSEMSDIGNTSHAESEVIKKSSESRQKKQLVKTRKTAKKLISPESCVKKNTSKSLRPKKSSSKEDTDGKQKQKKVEMKEMSSSVDSEGSESISPESCVKKNETASKSLRPKKSSSKEDTDGKKKQKEVEMKAISSSVDSEGSESISLEPCFKKNKRDEALTSSKSSDPKKGSSKVDTDRKEKKKKVEMKEISSSVESESSESDDDTAWQEPGVTFGWVKLTPNSRFQPAFIYPKEKGIKKRQAQYVLSKGKLSGHTHPVEAIATESEIQIAKKSRKSQNYLIGLKKFNAEHKTNY